jgi:hypothetical protein
MKSEANLSSTREPDLSAAQHEPVREQAKKPVLVKPQKPELEGVDFVTAYSAEILPIT